MDRVCRWRRLDRPGLELMHLTRLGDGLRARSTIIDAGDQPFGLSYDWHLDQDWRTRRLDLRFDDGRAMAIERDGDGWRVDGKTRPDLAGCAEIDLSATPLCNSLAVRHLGGAGEMTALYLALPALEPVPSRQRYDRIDATRVRYVDLGANDGFAAVIELDADGLVRRYQGLFEEQDAASSGPTLEELDEALAFEDDENGACDLAGVMRDRIRAAVQRHRRLR